MEKDIVKLIQKCIVDAKTSSPPIYFITDEEIASTVNCSVEDVKEVVSVLYERGWLDGASGIYCICVQNPRKIR